MVSGVNGVARGGWWCLELAEEAGVSSQGLEHDWC